KRVSAARFERHPNEVGLVWPLNDVVASPYTHAPAVATNRLLGAVSTIKGYHGIAEVNLEIESRCREHLLVAVRHASLHIVQIVDAGAQWKRQPFLYKEAGHPSSE